MYSSGNAKVYGLGSTQCVVGLSASAAVDLTLIKYCQGGFIKIQGGAGTLAIVTGVSNIFSQGYLLGTTEVVELQGPAKFYLAAAAATMTVGVGIRYAQGLSSAPPV